MSTAISGHRPPLAEVPGVEVSASEHGIEPAAGERLTPIVVVLGAHRSGTSLCSHILALLGVDMADVVNAHRFNAKGEWERWELTRLHDRLLDLFDRGYASLHHDLPLPVGWWADPRVRAIQQAITTFLRRRMPEGALFGFKDPRAALLLPLWQQVFKDLRLTPKIVLCLRNPAQVARSLATRDGLDSEIGEYRWFTYMIEALGNLQNTDVCTVEYEDWFVGPQANLDKLMRFLGIEWGLSPTDLRIATNYVVDPGLRHEDAGSVEARQPLVRSLYSLARSFADDSSAREGVRHLGEQFAVYRELHVAHFREFERISNESIKQREGARQEALLRFELERKVSEATQRGDGLAAALKTTQAELGLIRDRLDRAERTAEQFEQISNEAQALNDLLRTQLAKAESERGGLAEERTRIGKECDRLAEARDRACNDRDRVATESARWFDAAILAAAERVTRSRVPPGWRFGNHVLEIRRARGRGSPMRRADCARDAHQWERAARFYLEALDQLGDRPAIWVQLGHALKEAGKSAEAEFAYRRAVELDNVNADALISLGQLLRRQQRNDEAALAFRRARDLSLPAEKRSYISSELAALADHVSTT